MTAPAKPVRRIRLTIEYNGAPFEGWQVQKRGARTVQGELSAAFERLLKHEVTVFGAGRTDAGVHALGMTAHLDTTNSMPVVKIPVAMRKFLPPEISIRSATEVPPDFDSRRGAVLRWYRYQMALDPAPHPLGPRVWRPLGPLDRTKMERALRHLQGRHDFQAFRTRDCTASRTVLDLDQASMTVTRMNPVAPMTGSGTVLEQTGDLPHDALIALDFKSRSFLQRMVRFMVGAVVGAGRSKLTMKELDEILRTGRRPEVIEAAPPTGLCLMGIAYTDEERAKLLTHTPPPPSF